MKGTKRGNRMCYSESTKHTHTYRRNEAEEEEKKTINKQILRTLYKNIQNAILITNSELMCYA